MSKGAQFRDGVIDALRRDLMGPLADSSGCYPMAEPKRIDVVAGVSDMKELHGLLVHEDGEELLPYPPTSRYGIGVLFPRLTVDAEKQLNNEEEPTNEEGSSAGGAVPKPPEVTDLGTEIEEPPEDPEIQRAPRPSAMGFSFVVDKSDFVDVTLRLARYEEIWVPVGNTTVRLWHRLPMPESVHRFELASPSSRSAEFDVVFGPVVAKIGCVVRGSNTADNIVTCYVRNSTPLPSGDHHPATGSIFQVELQAQVSTGNLLQYPSALGLRDQEDAMLSLLYTDSPVRAVGHGCDAIAEDTLSGHLVRSQAIPVAAVLATNTDTIDSEGDVISVGMKALGEWDRDAVAAVDRIIESYDVWIAKHRIMAVSPTAADNLSKCETFLNDLREGWELTKTNEEVQRCLRWVCHAMSQQQRSYVQQLEQSPRLMTVSKSVRPLAKSDRSPVGGAFRSPSS